MNVYVVKKYQKLGEDEWIEGVFVDQRELALSVLEGCKYDKRRLKDKCFHYILEVYEDCYLISDEDDNYDEDSRTRLHFAVESNEYLDIFASCPWIPSEVIE